MSRGAASSARCGISSTCGGGGGAGIEGFVAFAGLIARTVTAPVFLSTVSFALRIVGFTTLTTAVLAGLPAGFADFSAFGAAAFFPFCDLLVFATRAPYHLGRTCVA